VRGGGREGCVAAVDCGIQLKRAFKTPVGWDAVGLESSMIDVGGRWGS